MNNQMRGNETKKTRPCVTLYDKEMILLNQMRAVNVTLQGGFSFFFKQCIQYYEAHFVPSLLIEHFLQVQINRLEK